jgi:hypothetical protein
MGEIFREYSGMFDALTGICGEYDAAELELIGGFLDRVAAAATEQVSAE